MRKVTKLCCFQNLKQFFVKKVFDKKVGKLMEAASLFPQGHLLITQRY